MNERIVNCKITSLAAQVDESVPFEWQGKQFDSGPLTVELDENAPVSANQGVLNYSDRRARAEFHLRLYQVCESRHRFVRAPRVK